MDSERVVGRNELVQVHERRVRVHAVSARTSRAITRSSRATTTSTAMGEATSTRSPPTGSSSTLDTPTEARRCSGQSSSAARSRSAPQEPAARGLSLATAHRAPRVIDPIRIVVAADHPPFRDGVVSSLRASEDIVVVGEAADASCALALVQQHLPDVALLDIAMPGGGIRAAAASRSLRRRRRSSCSPPPRTRTTCSPR